MRITHTTLPPESPAKSSRSPAPMEAEFQLLPSHWYTGAPPV